MKVSMGKKKAPRKKLPRFEAALPVTTVQLTLAKDGNPFLPKDTRTLVADSIENCAFHGPVTIMPAGKKIDRRNTPYTLSLEAPMLRPGLKITAGPVSERYVVETGRKLMGFARELNEEPSNG